MSYSDFVSTLYYGFSLLYNSLVYLVNFLIDNYFIITLIGLGLFISLVYFLLDLIKDFHFKSTKNLDDVGGGKR